MKKPQVLEFNKCNARFLQVVTHTHDEVVPMDILEYSMPEYFLYYNDKSISHLFEEYKYAYHVFKIFSN